MFRAYREVVGALGLVENSESCKDELPLSLKIRRSGGDFDELQVVCDLFLAS